jgi:hypothetical protein
MGAAKTTTIIILITKVISEVRFVVGGHALTQIKMSLGKEDMAVKTTFQEVSQTEVQ